MQIVAFGLEPDEMHGKWAEAVGDQLAVSVAFEFRSLGSASFVRVNMMGLVPSGFLALVREARRLPID